MARPLSKKTLKRASVAPAATHDVRAAALSSLLPDLSYSSIQETQVLQIPSKFYSTLHSVSRSSQCLTSLLISSSTRTLSTSQLLEARLPPEQSLSGRSELLLSFLPRSLQPLSLVPQDLLHVPRSTKVVVSLASRKASKLPRSQPTAVTRLLSLLTSLDASQPSSVPESLQHLQHLRNPRHKHGNSVGLGQSV